MLFALSCVVVAISAPARNLNTDGPGRGESFHTQPSTPTPQKQPFFFGWRLLFLVSSTNERRVDRAHTTTCAHMIR
jgi:hypothetical protein